MRKHPLRVMIATMVVAYGLLAVTILMGKTPTLGLDLQGGISVNLQPVKDGKVDDDVPSEQLDQAIGIIRKRVDALGVSEPEVSRQGNNILIQLPGAKDQQEVLDVLGKTAELRFRPVLEDVGKIPTGSDRKKAETEVADLRTQLNIPESVTAAQIVADEQAKQTAANPAAVDPNAAAPTTAPAASTTAPRAPVTTAAPATTIDPTADSGSGGNRSVKPRAQADPTIPPSTTPAPTTTVPPTPLNQFGVNVYDQAFSTLYQLETQLQAQTTPSGDDKAEAEVTLADGDGNLYKLGPTLLTGKAVETAQSSLGQDGKWTVNPVFRSGADGIDKFNEVASKCFSGAPECPASAGGKGRLAIVLDSEVLSAPSINEAEFQRDQIQISGDFSEEDAKNLAVALRFGSLPIELQPQQAEIVSATLGEDELLQAGIIAGLIGLFLVCSYLILYYRELGLATVGALTISASMLWVIMCWINATVTLAGVVGIVVSIGISLDSSIVFFETIKEDVRNGAGLRPSIEKSFSSAYATIVKADISSLIGAGVLYWLSVGPVRGFAFYLGVATVLDLVSAYFFLRPSVVVLSRSSQGEHPQRFGIPVDDLQEVAEREAHGSRSPIGAVTASAAGPSAAAAPEGA